MSKKQLWVVFFIVESSWRDTLWMTLLGIKQTKIKALLDFSCYDKFLVFVYKHIFRLRLNSVLVVV